MTRPMLGKRAWGLRVIPCHASFRVVPCRAILLSGALRVMPCHSWRLHVRAVSCHVMSLVCLAVAVPCLDFMQVPYSASCRVIFIPCSVPS